MKMTRLTALPIVAAALLSGCHTYPVQPPPPVYAVTAAPLPESGKCVSEAVVPLSVNLAVAPHDDVSKGVAARLDSAVRGELVSMGYKVEASANSDISISAEVESGAFDRSGNYIVLDAKVRMRATLHGPDARLLDDATFDVRGARGLGQSQAESNLSRAMMEPLAAWLKRSLSNDAVPCHAVAFEVEFGKPIETSEDVAAIERIRSAAAALDGARSVTLVSQDNATGTATFRAVYEKAKFPTGFINALISANPGLPLILADHGNGN